MIIKSKTGNKAGNPEPNAQDREGEPSVTISIPALSLSTGPSFRLPVWVSATQERTTKSLERLSGKGPLTDSLETLAGSLPDGTLDPASLLGYCRDVLAPMAQQQTGSRRFTLRIPAERLTEVMPQGLVIYFSEPGEVKATLERKPLDNLQFG